MSFAPHRRLLALAPGNFAGAPPRPAAARTPVASLIDTWSAFATQYPAVKRLSASIAAARA